MVGSNDISLWNGPFVGPHSFIFVGKHHLLTLHLPGARPPFPPVKSIPRIWTLLELPPMMEVVGTQQTPAQTKPDDFFGTKSVMAAADWTKKSVGQWEVDWTPKICGQWFFLAKVKHGKSATIHKTPKTWCSKNYSCTSGSISWNLVSLWGTTLPWPSALLVFEGIMKNYDDLKLQPVLGLFTPPEVNSTLLGNGSKTPPNFKPKRYDWRMAWKWLDPYKYTNQTSKLRRYLPGCLGVNKDVFFSSPCSSLIGQAERTTPDIFAGHPEEWHGDQKASLGSLSTL